MTGRVSSRPWPAGLLRRGGTEPLPVRPLLTTPPRLQHQAFADLQRQRLAAQPWLGVAGLLLGAAVFFALVLGTGSTRTSLLVLGPLSTFALPAVAMVAFWWNDWPGSRLTTPWAGLTDTLLVAAASVVLTIAGQAVVERADLRGVFEASPGPGVPTTSRLPWPWPARRSAPCSSCRWSANAGRWAASGASGLASARSHSPGQSGPAPTSCSSTSTQCQPPNAPPPGCATPAAPSPDPTSAQRSSPSESGRPCSSSPCAAGPSTRSTGARIACSRATRSSSAWAH